MIKLIISGANGHMGRTLARLAGEEPDMRVVAGVDVNLAKNDDYPIYLDPMEYGGDADVLIDFSSPAALPALLRCATARKLPLVLCTTGYTSEHLDKIREASRAVPIFRSGNMSLGINLTADLIRRAAEFLGTGFDVEIVERHHNRKIDAPSGTALMLADAVRSARPDIESAEQYVYERQSRREPRPKNEIGISAVRGGTIVGEHEVIFAGVDEVIEIRHSAYSRDVFAVGAVKAARFMSTRTAPGLYDMSDVLAEI
jgi:4-hydroxy-tetrahydrodipicolinate reductase